MGGKNMDRMDRIRLKNICFSFLFNSGLMRLQAMTPEGKCQKIFLNGNNKHRTDLLPT